MEKKPEETTMEDFNKLFRDLTGEKSTEERLVELAKTRDLFTVKEAIGYADQMRKLEMPTIGYHVNYYPLRNQDRLEINSVIDTNQNIQREKRSRKKLYLILHRAYPQVTEKWVEELSANITDTILAEYDKEEDARFLLPLMRRRRTG